MPYFLNSHQQKLARLILNLTCSALPSVFGFCRAPSSLPEQTWPVMRVEGHSVVRPGSVLEVGQLVGAVSGLWCVCVCARVCVWCYAKYMQNSNTPGGRCQAYIMCGWCLSHLHKMTTYEPQNCNIVYIWQLHNAYIIHTFACSYTELLKPPVSLTLFSSKCHKMSSITYTYSFYIHFMQWCLYLHINYIHVYNR